MTRTAATGPDTRTRIMDIAQEAILQKGFDAEVRGLNRRAVLGWRARLRAMFDEIAEAYPPREEVDLEALADMISTVVEGGIVMSKSLGEPHMIVGQILLLRQFLRQMFQPRLH